MLRRLEDFFYGFDFFISYSWCDGAKYAQSLFRKLKARGYVCFLDSKSYEAGANWRVDGRLALKKSKRLILVATPGALDSIPVLEEVRYFRNSPSRGKAIIPIDINETIASGPKDNPIIQTLDPDAIRIRQDDWTPTSEPSAAVFSALILGFQIRKQVEIRLRGIRAFATILAFLLVAAIISSVAAHMSATKERLARKQSEAKAYGLSIRTASQAIQRRRPDEARSVLLSCTPELRNLEWAFLVSKCGPAPTKITPELNTWFAREAKFSASNQESHSGIVQSGEGTSWDATGQHLLGTEYARAFFGGRGNPASNIHLDHVLQSSNGIVFEWDEQSGRAGTGGVLYRRNPITSLLYTCTGMYGSLKNAQLSADCSILRFETSGFENGWFTDQGDELRDEGEWAIAVPDLYDFTQYTEEDSRSTGNIECRKHTSDGFELAMFGPSEPDKAWFHTVDGRSPNSRVTTVVFPRDRYWYGASAMEMSSNSDEPGMRDRAWFSCENAPGHSNDAIAVSPQGQLELWDSHSKKLKRSFGAPNPNTLDAQTLENFRNYTARAACISPDATGVFGFPLENRKVGCVFDFSTSQRICTVKDRNGEDYQFPTTATYHFETASFSPLGTAVWFCYKDRNDWFRGVWDTRTGQAVSWFTDNVDLFAWDNKEQYLVVTGKDVKVLHYPSLEVACTLTAKNIRGNRFGRQQFPVAVSPDGSRLLAGPYLLNTTTSPFEVILELPYGTTVTNDWRSMLIVSPNGMVERVSLDFFLSSKNNDLNGQLTLRDKLLLQQFSLPPNSLK